MDADSQFWWNWWVRLAAAIATTLAVLVALFGDWVRSRLFQPKLKLELRNPSGEKTKIRWNEQTQQGLKEMMAEVRYYHVRVSNQRRWPSATQVQVYLMLVEEPGPDSKPQITWSGDLPIQWVHQAINPLSRTIGAAYSCDLCSVVKDKYVQLHLLVSPHNLPVQRPGPMQLILSLQARGNEGVSAISRFQIAWDGKWADGDHEMMRHFVVRDITGTA